MSAGADWGGGGGGGGGAVADPERFQGFHKTPLSAKTHHILPQCMALQLKR